MIALLQRVQQARVVVDGRTVGAIEQGLLVFLAIESGDEDAQAQRLAERLLAYRIFSDPAGRMNLSVADSGGGVLLVPQFTLAADTTRGLRPSFAKSASPQEAQRLYDKVLAWLREHHAGAVASGVFGAHMQVHLLNDGPVSFLLRA